MKQEAIITLNNKINHIQTAMLITQDEQGNFRSRPMATTAIDESGLIWFLTREHSAKVREINRNPTVNISYADPTAEMYLSVSGQANLVKDKRRIKQLWNSQLANWFKDASDPGIALLRITVGKVEYWDQASKQMISLLNFVPASSSGHVHPSGANERIDEH